MGGRKLFLLWSCITVLRVLGSPVVKEVNPSDLSDEPQNSKNGVRPDSHLSLEDIPSSLTSPPGSTATIQSSRDPNTPKSSLSTIFTPKSSAAASQTVTASAGTASPVSPTSVAATSPTNGTSNPQSTGAPNATQPLKDYITVKTDADVTWCRPWPNTVITTPSALHIYKLTELNLTCWVPTDLQVGPDGLAQPDAHDIWVKTGTQGCYINENDLKASQLDFEFILRPCTAPGPYPLEPNPGKQTSGAGSIIVTLKTTATAKTTGGLGVTGSSGTVKTSATPSSAVPIPKGPDISSAKQSPTAITSPVASKQPSASASRVTASPVTPLPAPASPSPSPKSPTPNLSSPAAPSASDIKPSPSAATQSPVVSTASTASTASPAKSSLSSLVTPTGTSAVSSVVTSASSSHVTSAFTSAASLATPNVSLPTAPNPRSSISSHTSTASPIPTRGVPDVNGESTALPKSSRTLTPIGQVYTPSFSSSKPSQTQ